MKLLLIIYLFSQSLLAFTLSESKGRGFPNKNINVYISPTDCSGAGFTTAKLKSMVSNAVAEYWNRVPTSDLYLDVKGINNDMDLDGLTHSNAINNIVPENAIVAGCNDDADGFGNTSILGSALISCASDSRCKAVLILNANNSALNNFSSSEIESVIAHEIGHAIGLGHTEDKHNVMYYSTGNKIQKWLGQDDVDGVTYLYPHEEEGCGLLGNMGATIKFLDKDDDDFNFPFSGVVIFSFLMTLMIFKLLINYRKIFAIKLY